MSMPPDTPEQAREAAAIRRRWITLGEVLAVLAVLISGLTLWNSYRDRSNDEAERVAERKDAAAKAETLLLKASAGKEGARLALAPANSDQVIQSQTIAFASATGRSRIETVADPRVEAGWIKDAAKSVKGKDGEAGDRRLPVAITTRFVRDGETHSDTAIYDVGYSLDSGFLGGTDVRLGGLSLVERTSAAKAQARLDSLWKARQGT